ASSLLTLSAAPSSPAVCRLPCPRLPVVVRSSSSPPSCGSLQSPSWSQFRVVEKPKEYICREVDIVVDHVGNVSASLDGLISQTNAFSDAELRESNASNKYSKQLMCL
ncbi:hypothetical protein S245_065542, partial [Arachis hypogaea]